MPLSSMAADLSIGTIVTAVLAVCVAAVAANVINQIYFPNPNEPPVVFHIFPFLGSTIPYGIDPYNFFFKSRDKYGDIFTFILLGRRTTVYLGTKGNDFILNSKLKDVNAEEVYNPLTGPIFGKDVVYDCPNAKFMEQKKFIKSGLTTSALKSYVASIAEETHDFFARTASHGKFKADRGDMDVVPTVAELTIYTASRSLQGIEIREKFDSTFAELYHDLDMGFSPINFILPWAPLPHNKKRDHAQMIMTDTYMSIIKQKRQTPPTEESMIWSLMQCSYKDDTPLRDHEIAGMMIALLMAGQHSSSSTLSWMLLNMSGRPDIQEELLEEQKRVLGVNPDGTIKPLEYDHIPSLTLHNQIVKETLRIHAPIHSIMRKVKSPLAVPGTPFVIPTSHNVLSAPGATSRMDHYFPEPLLWEPHRWDPTPSAEYAHLAPANVAPVSDEKEDYGYGLVTKGATSPYLPFGAGRHRCIGEQFAYVQLQTMLVAIVKDFKIKNVEPFKGLVGTDYSSLFSRPLPPAIIKWERRQPAKAA